jgi:hypothetical protein
MKSKYHILFLVIASFLVAGCSIKKVPGDDGSVNSRTHYESLDIHTPETAVQTFVQAFQQSDFATAHLVLAPTTQQTLLNNRARLQYDGLILLGSPPDYPTPFKEAWAREVWNLEHLYDGVFQFQLLMRTAVEYDALQFHFPGPLTIVASRNSETPSGQEAIDVESQVAGIDGTVVFRMVQAPSGRWRVFQVVFPGGNEKKFPWSLPATGMRPSSYDHPISSRGSHTYYDSLDLATPEAAVSSFSEAFRQRDFPTLFLIFHTETQSAWLSHFSRRHYHNLVAIEEPSRILPATEFAQRLRALAASGILTQHEADMTFFHLTLSSAYIGSLALQGTPYIPLVMEHVGDASYLFDQVMLAAEGKYLVDLSKEVVILETGFQQFEDGEISATVTGNLEGIEGGVVFRLKQSPSGRWRVLQVIVPGGDEELYPWAASRDLE